MADLKLSDSPNVDTGYAQTDDGKQHKVNLVANLPADNIELSDSPNVDSGYVTIDGKKHKVKLTASLYGSGGGSGGGDVSSVNGKRGAVVLTGADINATLTGGGDPVTATVTEHLQTLKNDEAALGTQVSGIEEKIPAKASSTNQLATMEDVQGGSIFVGSGLGGDGTETNPLYARQISGEGRTMGTSSSWYGISINTIPATIPFGHYDVLIKSNTIADAWVKFEFTPNYDKTISIKQVAQGPAWTVTSLYKVTEAAGDYLDVSIWCGTTHLPNEIRSIYTASVGWYGINEERMPVGVATIRTAPAGTESTIPQQDTGGLSAVAHDATLTGDGTAASPLSVVGGGAGDEYLPLTGGTLTGSLTLQNRMQFSGGDNFVAHLIPAYDDPSRPAGLDVWVNNWGRGVSFRSDAIVPSVNNAHDLGVDNLRWRSLYTQNINGQIIPTNGNVIITSPTALPAASSEYLNQTYMFTGYDSTGTFKQNHLYQCKMIDMGVFGWVDVTPTAGGATATDDNGLEGDYATRYGIVDETKSGLPTITTGNQVKIPAQLVLDVPGVAGLTTNASDIIYDIKSTTDCTLFLTNGEVLEATDVFFQETEPEDGTTGYAAWWNGTEWKFKSNDTGNVWRAANAVRIAKCVFTNGTLTRLCFTGCRLLNKQEFLASSGGALNGILTVIDPDITVTTGEPTIAAAGQNLVFFGLGENKNMGGIRINSNTIYAYSGLRIGSPGNLCAGVYTQNLNNGADIAIPTTGGTMVVATPPTAEGNYTLKATVTADGTVTTAWVKDA